MACAPVCIFLIGYVLRNVFAWLYEDEDWYRDDIRLVTTWENGVEGRNASVTSSEEPSDFIELNLISNT